MQRFRIAPDQKIKLKNWDPADTGGFDGGKDEGKQQLLELNHRLEDLQERLYAEHRHKILIVLQGMDTSGKDGTIRHVFEGVNPQGVRVATFKKPTRIELDRDFLWRVHLQVPGRGQLVIFNRSHYEDVLIVRVHELVSKDTWQARYEHINAFEIMLTDEGTIILKFFLHISKAEQRERLQARLDDPAKHWKFDPQDISERQRWSAYQDAYEDVLSKTSTPHAPWYIVPSDRKWFRNLLIAQVIVDALDKLNPQPPKVTFDPKAIQIQD